MKNVYIRNLWLSTGGFMKELLIIWDDDTEMFYHDYFCSSLFADVLEHLIKKYKLNGSLEQSESYTLHKLNYLNSDKFVIKLVDEFNQELPLF